MNYLQQGAYVFTQAHIFFYSSHSNNYHFQSLHFIMLFAYIYANHHFAAAYKNPIANSKDHAHMCLYI